jgi:hypothetical protein
MPRPQAALFVELDEDRDRADAEREAVETGPIEEWPVADPDLVLDRGPSKLWQRRIPGAGWVRDTENPTPTFRLPPQTSLSRRFDCCDVCKTFTRVDNWTRRCEKCNQ